MLSREKIYRRIGELKEDINRLEYERFHTPVDLSFNHFWFDTRIDQLNWMIEQRRSEVKKLQSLLYRDDNTKTIHLTITYEEDLDIEKILRNGIKGISL